MTKTQAIADVFWIAFRTVAVKDQIAFLEKLSGQEQYVEMLEDLCDGKIIDHRKEEPRCSLEAVVRRRSSNR